MPHRAGLAGLLLLLLAPALALGESSPPVTGLKGKFLDSSTHAPVPAVSVKLTSFADSSDVHRATGRDDGTFEVPGLGVHSYRLEATRLGYDTLSMVIRVTRPKQDAGVLALDPKAIPVGGITVNESPSPAVQKADTTEFRASAVKTNKDATAEDLVQKLPGVTMENGQIKAHGEAVQQVLVNGKPFMGSDPAAAMRNLPAEVVDRIQVYDRMSDQAEFSGFDDGQSQKTMNFILRNLKTQFGKVYGGYGNRDLYQGGGNYTRIRGATRITLLGLSNNINQRNFSPQDLFGALSGSGGNGSGPRITMFGGGGGMRGAGGGAPQIMRMGGGGGGGVDPSSFFVGQQSGVSTTHSGGGNYVGQWGKKLQVSSSVFLNLTDTDNDQTLARAYTPAQDSIATYDQLSRTHGSNGNQRFDARFEWTPDSSNSAIFQPRLYFQQTKNRNLSDGTNGSVIGSTLSSAINDVNSDIAGDNLSGRLTLRHRFARRGRNVSADLNAAHNLRDGPGSQLARTDYYSGTTVVSDTVDQRSESQGTTNTYSARLAYTEPLTRRVQAQLVWNPSLSRSVSDARVLTPDLATGVYSVPDTGLSNSFENRATSQSGGLSVLYSRGTWRWLTTASYQTTLLESEQTWPLSNTVRNDYHAVLPSLTLSGSFTGNRNFRLAWSTAMNTPSINQLQNVVDNSNPLSLSVGNPALRPTYNNVLSLRYSEANPAKSTSRFVFLNVVRTTHTISNATFTARVDTTISGVDLARGTQVTTPVNLDDSWSVNAFGVSSLPLKPLKSIWSLNGGGSFTRTPTQVNESNYRSDNYALRVGSTLASNISPNLDFTVTYQGTYNIARNTLGAPTPDDYYTHTLGLRFTSTVGPGVVVRQEVNQNLQAGVPAATDKTVLLWTMSVGKKFLKDNKGEFRVAGTDVLKQDRNVNRSVTETYVQDTHDRTLGRYLQAVFTYTFR
jgi:hypothetical protein